MSTPNSQGHDASVEGTKGPRLQDRLLRIVYEPIPAVVYDPTRSVQTIEDELHAAGCEVERLERQAQRAMIGPSIATLALYFTVLGLVLGPMITDDWVYFVFFLPVIVAVAVLSVTILATSMRWDFEYANAKNRVRHLTLELERARAAASAEKGLRRRLGRWWASKAQRG